jgi:hypothetical protein
MGEADYRRMLEDAGFTDLVIRVGRGGLFARGRKPIPSNTSTDFDPDERQEPADAVEFALNPAEVKTSSGLGARYGAV